jgi:hypothetical protein
MKSVYFFTVISGLTRDLYILYIPRVHTVSGGILFLVLSICRDIYETIKYFSTSSTVLYTTAPAIYPPVYLVIYTYLYRTTIIHEIHT